MLTELLGRGTVLVGWAKAASSRKGALSAGPSPLATKCLQIAEGTCAEGNFIHTEKWDMLPEIRLPLQVLGFTAGNPGEERTSCHRDNHCTHTHPFLNLDAWSNRVITSLCTHCFPPPHEDPRGQNDVLIYQMPVVVLLKQNKGHHSAKCLFLDAKQSVQTVLWEPWDDNPL